MTKIDMVVSSGKARQISGNTNDDGLPYTNDYSHELSDTIHASVHDMRSPLSVIKPYISFLKRIDDKEKRNSILNMMDVSVVKMEKIIKGLVEYTDILLLESPKVEKFCFEHILDWTKIELDELILDSNAIILSDFSISSEIIFPIPHFKKILFHLLDNAIRYGHPDRNPIIRIYTQRTKYNTIFTIIDNGEGMNMEESREYLGKPFTKLKKDSKSVGLGLAIVKALINKNGGEFHMESNIGGTTIQLILAN